MITGAPILDGAGWVPIPNETARDKRISRRALGLLVELLSYPSGWDNTADSLSAKGREGREGTRAAMRELESAGYVVQVRYSAGGGLWRTAAFAGSMPDVARKLADEWLAENPGLVLAEKPRSHRGTGIRASVDRASDIRTSDSWASSTYKTDSKTEEKKVEQDQQDDAAIAASRSPDAYASGTGDAVASPRAQDQSTRDPRDERRRPARRVSLSDHLAGLDPDEIDDMLTELECSRMGIVDWALPIACRALRLDEDSDPHDEIGGRLAVKVLSLALPALYRHSGLPTVVEDALAGYAWPYEPDWLAPAAPAKPREATFTEYAYTKKGLEHEAVLSSVYSAVADCDSAEIAELSAAFRSNRPRIFQECTQQAIDQLKLTDADADCEAVRCLALKYGLRHYCGKWPTWLLPSAVRPAPASAAA